MHEILFWMIYCERWYLTYIYMLLSTLAVCFETWRDVLKMFFPFRGVPLCLTIVCELVLYLFSFLVQVWLIPWVNVVFSFLLLVWLIPGVNVVFSFLLLVWLFPGVTVIEDWALYIMLRNGAINNFSLSLCLKYFLLEISVHLPI